MSTIEPGSTERRRRRQPRIPEPVLTLSIPEAGRRYFGLSKNGSYLAANRGDFPTIRIGRKRRVPIAALDRLLEEAGRLRRF